MTSSIPKAAAVAGVLLVACTCSATAKTIVLDYNERRYLTGSPWENTWIEDGFETRVDAGGIAVSGYDDARGFVPAWGAAKVSWRSLDPVDPVFDAISIDIDYWSSWRRPTPGYDPLFQGVKQNGEIVEHQAITGQGTTVFFGEAFRGIVELRTRQAGGRCSLKFDNATLETASVPVPAALPLAGLGLGLLGLAGRRRGVH